MKTFLIIIFCLFISLCIINAILCLYSKYLNYKNAKLNCELAELSYTHLMLMRKLYHESKFIDNELEKERIQTECIAGYNNDISILEELSDPNAEFRKFLTKNQAKDLDKTLSLPRYKLF